MASRWSYIQLTDRGIRGGTLHNWPLGLNWYLNAHSKVQFNYIRAFLEDSLDQKSQTDIYGLRAQVDY